LYPSTISLPERVGVTVGGGVVGVSRDRENELHTSTAANITITTVTPANLFNCTPPDRL
jgi:hypothetical protein